MKKISNKDQEKLDELKAKAWEALGQLNIMLKERAEYAQEWLDERSDKWLDSPKGRAYEEWIGDIEVKAEEVEKARDALDDIDFEYISAPQEI